VIDNGVVDVAIQRAFDILGCEDAIGVIGHLEASPDHAVAVLVALEAIEQRRGPSDDSRPRSEPLMLSRPWRAKNAVLSLRGRPIRPRTARLTAK
jgi:hypothetical protein